MSRIAERLGLNTESAILAHNRRVQAGRMDARRDTAIEQAKTFTPETPRIGVKGVIRQSSRQMNKTEARFELEHIKPLYYEQEIVDWDYEAHTLKIANGCKYTPDFWAINRQGVTVYFEIKARGMIWDDAIVKLKVAAAKYVNCEFYLCAWSAQGWTIERVLA